MNNYFMRKFIIAILFANSNWISLSSMQVFVKSSENNTKTSNINLGPIYHRKSIEYNNGDTSQSCRCCWGCLSQIENNKYIKYSSKKIDAVGNEVARKNILKKSFSQKGTLMQCTKYCQRYHGNAVYDNAKFAVEIFFCNFLGLISCDCFSIEEKIALIPGDSYKTCLCCPTFLNNVGVKKSKTQESFDILLSASEKKNL